VTFVESKVMKNLLLLLLCLLFHGVSAQNVGVDIASPQEKLDIAGRLRLSSDITVGAPTGGAGTIRWNASAGQFQGWNGTSWTSFSSAAETDPIFSASPSAGITGTNITNWNTAFGWGNHASAGYLTSFTETDPIFSASPSFGITGTNITNWNTAFGWGNHASAGYLTSFTETDPIFSASPSFGITGTNITNWNTAFGWGNHATAGYLTSFTELDPTWDGPANFTGDINRTGNVGIGGAPSEKLHVTGNVRATTGFIANDGTVGTPAIRFSSSPTTGIYRQAADAIGVSTAGVERIRVIADGKVGIGITTDPTEILEAAGNVKLTAGANREITVAMESSTANGPLAKDLLIRAGNANFNDNGYAQRGGDLVLQAGRGFTNTVANAHGGHVIIRSGANHLNSGSQKNGGDIILETGGGANAVTERLRFSDTGVLTLPTINTSGANRLLNISAAGVVSTSNIDPANVGTVSSVALSLPAIFSVSGSPITSSGTLTGTLANQTANTVFSGPATGGAAAPTFRALVAADIPNLDASKITTGTLPIARGGTNSATALNNNRVMISSGGAIVENAALTANLPVYTNASGLLTTTAPATGVQGYWTRTGTNLHNTTLTDNVGVGTSNPPQKLSVVGTMAVGDGASNGNRLRLSADATSAILNYANNAPLIVQVNSSEKLRISDNGIFSLNNSNSQAYPPYNGGGGGAISWNFTGGAGEVSIWNNVSAGSPRGFSFRQMTSASAQTELMRLEGNGGIFGKFRHITYHNFNIPSGGYTANNGYVWFPSAGSEGANDNIVNGSRTNFIAQSTLMPYAGRLVGVIIRVDFDSNPGDEIKGRLAVDVNGGITTSSVGVNLNQGQTGTYMLPATGYTFNRGDRVVIGVNLFNNAACNGGTCWVEDNNFWVTAIWEYNMQD
jgi:hypothetical protein